MEPVPTKVTLIAAPRRGRLLLLAAFLAAGCVGPQKAANAPAAPLVAAHKKVLAYDPATPTQLAVAWNPRVAYAADPTRGGTIMPVLTGRMFMFAVDDKHPPGYPITCDGSLKIDLWDHTPREGQSEPKMLEQWNIDPVTLAKLVKEDLFGLGYSLGLPWGTYREDMTALHLIVRFDPSNGRPHVLQQAGITVDHSATKELKAEQMATKLPKIGSMAVEQMGAKELVPLPLPQR